MLIRNKHPETREIVDTGDHVEPGETVEVPDELGKSLVQQVDVWESAEDVKKSRKSTEESS